MRNVSFCLAGFITAAAGAAVVDDSSIKTAVAAWLAGAPAAEATYGHISTWNTSQVTDMSMLFHNAQFFNDAIGAWDTSSVTTMFGMFSGATEFNQPLYDWDVSGVMHMVGMFAHAESFDRPLGAWDVSRVMSLDSMFYYASAFDQDLGWCIDAGVTFNSDTLQGTLCAVPKCGIGPGAEGTCAPTPAPSPIETSAGAAIEFAPATLGFLGGAAAHLF